MTQSINLAFDPAAGNVAGALHAAVERSMERLLSARNEKVSLSDLQMMEEEIKASIDESFADGSWQKTLPGRDILKAYSAHLPNGISFETLRNMIVHRMADTDVRPPEMAAVISAILADA